MKMEDCVLTAHRIGMRPIIRHEPEKDWLEAFNNKLIPDQMYRYYCIASFFSINKAPKFLDDPDRILFSYLSALIRGLKERFIESSDLIEKIKVDDTRIYSPTKKVKGEDWDPDASIRIRRNFRYLIMNISSILDQFSEVIAVFFHGEIPEITVGRSSFKILLEFVKTPYKQKGTIISPQEVKLLSIQSILFDELRIDGRNSDWIKLFYLYRNKLDHLGSQMFPVFRLHDIKGNYFTFLPKRWPLFHQTDIKLNQNIQDQEQETLEPYLKENYMQQDIISYSADLLKNINSLINKSFEVLCDTYLEFQNFELNRSALKSLRKKEEKYKFAHFA